MSLYPDQSALIQTYRMRRLRSLEFPGELGQEGSGLYPVYSSLCRLGKLVPHRLKNSFGEPSLFLLAEIAHRKAFSLNAVLAG